MGAQRDGGRKGWMQDLEVVDAECKWVWEGVGAGQSGMRWVQGKGNVEVNY